MNVKKKKFNEVVFKILIVDDEEEVLRSLTWVLESAEEFKCEITTATEAMTALAEMEMQNFDMILSDYKMPVMNGIELLSTAKAQYPATVRILITGYTDMKIAKEAINKADVHTYIEKPWVNEDLLLTIHEGLKRKFERENTRVKVCDKVKDALTLMGEMQKHFTAIPAAHITKQLIMLEFDSALEFNKFAFSLRKMKNAQIKDVQVYEDKHIISIVVHPEKYAFIPKIE